MSLDDPHTAYIINELAFLHKSQWNGPTTIMSRLKSRSSQEGRKVIDDKVLSLAENLMEIH